MRRQPAFRELLDRLPARGAILRVGGLPGSSPALLAATLTEAEPNRLWVAVADGTVEAEALESDLQTLVGAERVALFPQRESLSYEGEEHHVEVGGLRVEALEAVLAGRARVLVTTLRALQERSEIPSELAGLRTTLGVGDTIRLQELTDRLDELGFSRAPLVEGVGEYAVRGGILDLFGFGAAEPVRIEFWGDEIVSIRHFDILDQRSTEELREVDVLPVDLRAAARRSEAGGEPVRRSILDVLPRDALLVEMHEGAEEAFRRAWSQIQTLHQAARRRGRYAERPEKLYLPPEEAHERLERFARLTVVAGADAELRFQARAPEPVDRDMERLGGILRAGAARGEETLILCDNTGQLERLEELLADRGKLPPRASLGLGSLANGFVLEGAEPPLRVLTDHEIFRRDRRLRRGRRFRGAVAIESLAQLKPGDYVVHLDHGIGRFKGLERVRVLDEELEALAIEYAGGETLRVPVYRLDLIERWVPEQEASEPPRVHKIGGKTWRNLRKKTEAAIQAMATELLEIYAARQTAEGFAFSPDTRWQKEMESSFLYEDTPDQRLATEAVKRDMEAPRPMDRLLCGDVGYGKTEIAIRAAFKAVQDGKQVAVLAPTTILVEQHLHTFQQRLADYPVRIEALSRFRTAKEQEQILLGLAAGEVDIVVGTHRLLESDVVFDDLGLLIVDEEQRFGVKHKERLKELKRDVDVLTMTATPIPRTLHMSITGLRDLSQIQTPPRDRMPIITHVLPWTDEVLADAIHRELDRGGQVFFVHNRVQSIETVAERVRRLAPGEPIAVAHGQLPAAELDGIMRDFIEGRTRILVTTSIIENGVDVPNANTLIVDRADQFGLAQLYQIRGRVGRSHHRAYCYLIAPDGINEDAEKRLRILEHFTELGSGYAVALKDLELRGAGNLLGAEQSGFVHAVGLDTYTRLLEETVRSLREGEEGVTRHAPPEIALDGAAYLPDDYVPESSQKLHLYRRLSRLERAEQVTALREEVRDRFGPLPPEADRLLHAAALRLIGAALGVERINVREDEARIAFREGVVPRMAALQGAFHDRQLEVEVRRTMPLVLVLKRYGPQPLVETLTSALELLATQHARAA